LKIFPRWGARGSALKIYLRSAQRPGSHRGRFFRRGFVNPMQLQHPNPSRDHKGALLHSPSEFQMRSPNYRHSVPLFPSPGVHAWVRETRRYFPALFRGLARSIGIGSQSVLLRPGIAIPIGPALVATVSAFLAVGLSRNLNQTREHHPSPAGAKETQPITTSH
jgi:hypothetical protein